jgi:hypothetical protein
VPLGFSAKPAAGIGSTREKSPALAPKMSMPPITKRVPLVLRMYMVLTGSPVVPTSVGSTVISGVSCAPEGFARINTASNATSVAASATAIAPVWRAPRSATLVLFLERLRFYG